MEVSLTNAVFDSLGVSVLSGEPVFPLVVMLSIRAFMIAASVILLFALGVLLAAQSGQ